MTANSSSTAARSGSVAAFWSIRASELAFAFVFATALPWHTVFLWFGAMLTLSALRWWHMTRPAFRALAASQRKRVARIHVWLHMALVGSSAHFLYVPGNRLLLVVLALFLVATALIMAVDRSGDLLRSAIAVCLVLLPISLRFLFDGYHGDPLLAGLGASGILLTASTVVLSQLQERSALRQEEVRHRAEHDASAAKSRFFAAVSHDLRQPVHAIGLYLESLSQCVESSGDVVALRALSGIRQSWRALDGLLSQVLDLTRTDSGQLKAELEPVELAPLVRSLVLQHSAGAELAGVRIIALVAPHCFAAADELMLKRVLSNLIDNAVKFSPASSTVLVALRRGDASWRLQVRDAGPGIPLEAQARIFDEFVQLDNDARDSRQGLGLGLAISRRFTALMMGRLDVRSAPGRGCCMTIRLPPAKAPVQPDGRQPVPRFEEPLSAPASESAAAPSPLGFRQVLLVEDDPHVAIAMGDVLRSWGLEVRHVEDATQALTQLDFGQVAICDVRLPRGQSGLMLALQLRESGKKVVLVTAETDPELRERARQASLRLLTKPISVARLRATLQEL